MATISKYFPVSTVVSASFPNDLSLEAFNLLKSPRIIRPQLGQRDSKVDPQIER